MNQHESVVTKIQKLLRLASEANPNAEEAAAALAKAQQLMMSYDIEMLDVEVKTEPDEFARQFIGDPFNRRGTAQAFVVWIVQGFFQVQVVYSRIYRERKGTFVRYERVGRGRIRRVEVPELARKPDGKQAMQFLGRASHIAIAAYVYVFLIGEFPRLWKRHKAETGKGDWAREDFYRGLYEGLKQRLSDEQRREERNMAADEQNQFALVRKTEEAALAAYVNAECPRLGKRRHAMHAGRDVDSYVEGVIAGQNLNIRPAVNEGRGIRQLPRGSR
jgi:hypothetical protein